MTDTYRIVLTGDLEPGFERSSVVEGLIGLFRIPAGKAEILIGGSETVIKKDVDANTAAKYEEAVRKAGAACRVVPDALARDLSVTAAPPALATPTSAEPEPTFGPAGTEPPVEPPSGPPAASGGIAPEDPYAPPAAALLADVDDADVHEGQGVGFGRGIGWLIGGMKLFAGAPVIWIVIGLVYALIAIGGSLFPFIGPIAISVLYPVFLGGIMLGADRQQRGEALQVGDLFIGFSHRFGALAAVGGVYLGGSIAIAVVVGGIMAAIVGGNALLLAQMAQDGAGAPAMPATVVAGLIISLLVVLACLLPLYMAIWFAPTLIALHEDLSVGQALAMSFKGCLRNILGFTLYGIAIGIVLILAMIPLGLGLLVAGPIVLASMYVSYREVFVD